MNPESRPIIDAGPGLNFFSINKERLLIATLGPLASPESVRDEMLRKAGTDSRFSASKTVLGKLPEKWLRLDRLRAQGGHVGSIALVSTVTVLEKAVQRGHITDRGQMRELYSRLRGLDDGLPPIGSTPLLSPELW